MQEHKELALDALLAPIGDSGCGEDLGFSLLFDEIKEARRADPDYLSQGDWATELKLANWPQVIELTSEALCSQSKDLMLASWLCEALAHRDHFEGLAFGLHLMAKISSQYWETMFPEMEDGPEERLSRFSWLDSTLTQVVNELPLTQEHEYGLLHYQESRWVENLALQNPDAMEQALQDGKINAEIFQRAVVLSSTEFLRARHASVKVSLDQLALLTETLDQLLGDDAPVFRELREHLEQCVQLVERLLTDRGETLAPEEDVVSEDADVSASADSSDKASTVGGTAGAHAALRTTPRTREEAFELLNGVAQFFKQTEPHSPVPYLVERAIRWGRMPLEEWLRDVIHEDQVVDNIRETLGTQRRGESSEY
ncbi:type VI secretion system protein TssA [Zymobacter palmae]|uniref:Uncharacterized protein conserved in bacteria n=1 Tax=Zymobacter palmae TaxID=33074 RepID=A0A348HH21_9GAMM|nr:type VI secretion system protein TssA [Zymobacter palmae]BBG30923.1 uncharacterized protein conserved in bacteria [Zymobacter palmae]